MFDWDPAKAASSLSKRGVSFEEAISVFEYPRCLIVEDLAHSQVELRWVLIGYSGNECVLKVTYTLRRTNDVETIRIITARAASRKEIEAAARQRDRFFRFP